MKITGRGSYFQVIVLYVLTLLVYGHPLGVYSQDAEKISKCQYHILYLGLARIEIRI